MTEHRITSPENLIDDEKAPFVVMRDFMKEMFGAEYIEKVVRKSREEFAKGGVLGWQPTDANTVIDVSPMPEPWKGQWGFRIRMCAAVGGRADDMLINQFYVPASTIPLFRKGIFTSLQ